MDIAVSNSRLVSIGTNNQIQVYELSTDEERFESLKNIENAYNLEENDTITSISMSKDGRYLLTNVSLKNPRLDLWDLESKECVRKYKGHT